MSDIIWNIERRNLSDLKDYNKNPKECTQKTYEFLKDCIDKFGFIDKPFINTDNMIIGGHLRKRVLFELGYDEIDVYVPSRTLTEKEVEELCIRHNLHQGDWDFDMLANQFDASSLLKWGFDKIFDEKPKRKHKPKITLTFDDEDSCKRFSNELYIKMSSLIMSMGVKVKGNTNE